MEKLNREEVIERVERGESFEGIELRGLRLIWADLRGARMSGAVLSGANLFKADLSEADLKNAFIDNANLSRARLDSANLLGTNLTSTNLRGSSLCNTKLSGAELSHADLSGTNLKGAYLNYANMNGVKLMNANLIGARLTHAKLSHADLRGANLSHADLSGADMRNVRLENANLNSARLNDASLAGAVMRDADLSGAEMKGTDLSMAILEDAVLNSSSLCRAKLINADLARAKMSFVDLRSAYLSHARLKEAELSHADLRDADLRGADLRDVSLRDAKMPGVDLSHTLLGRTKLREENLAGVRYLPEQLHDLIIEKQKRNLLVSSGQKGLFSARFTKGNPSLMHLTWLNLFLEEHYETLFIFLFSQYESMDELKGILSGTLYHWFRDEEEVKIKNISPDPLGIELKAQSRVWILTFALFMMYKSLCNGENNDLYQCIRSAMRSARRKIKEEPLRSEITETYAGIIKKSRDTGVPLEIAFDKGPSSSSPWQESMRREHLFKLDSDILENHSPRIDYFKTILLLRQEGFLTNPLSEKELANLLEVLGLGFYQRYRLLLDQTGDFDVDIEIDEEEEDLF